MTCPTVLPGQGIIRFAGRVPVIFRSKDLEKITIYYFTDILCVWAYISDIRIQELKTKFKDRIEFNFTLFPVFGNVQDMIENSWQARGGLEGYAEHVQEVVSRFDHVRVHPDIWISRTPSSSMPAHLYLSAVRLAEQAGSAAVGAYEKLAWRMREAFFLEAADISDATVLKSILAEQQLPVTEVEGIISSGRAFALVAGEMQTAYNKHVRFSPTMIFNDDRQRLTGNVGYRIIEANIKELLERPELQHSWC